MAYQIDTVAVFLGARIGPDRAFEGRVERELSYLAQYMAARKRKVLYGGNNTGHDQTLVEAVREYGGKIECVLPPFYQTLSDAFASESGAVGEADLEGHIDAMLSFKRNFLSTAGAKFVFPGAPGTIAEYATSLEKEDVEVRFGMQVPLSPIIIMNIPTSSGVGYYDGEVQQLRTMVEMGRMDPERLNLVRAVQTTSEAIRLFEAYESLGPVPAAELDRFVPYVDGRQVTELEPDLRLRLDGHTFT